MNNWQRFVLEQSFHHMSELEAQEILTNRYARMATSWYCGFAPVFNHCLAPVFGEDVKSAFDSAIRISREKGHRYLDGTHLFAAWLLQQDRDPILPDYLELLHSLDSVVTNLGPLPGYLPSSIGPRVRAAIAMSSVDLHLSFSDKSVTRSDLVMVNSIVRGSVLEAVILQSGKSPISVVEHILDRFKLSALHGGLILKRLGFIPGPGNSGCA